jgi:voltage-gated potassium channel
MGDPGDQAQSPLLDRMIGKRVEKKGLRPRVAASVIAVLWLIAIVVFGIAEHVIDPDTFGTIWLGMWWATQTVTTVGYGDVVPDQAAGQVVATVLMIGGLSLFAVVTGVITSAFVARAQAEQGAGRDDLLMTKLDGMSSDVETLRAEVTRLAAQRGGADRPRD